MDEKTNEHKGSLPLLKELVMKGQVIVADTAFCQRDVCQQIVDSDGDYLIAVKENQPGILREITLEFAAKEAAFSPLHAASTPL